MKCYVHSGGRHIVSTLWKRRPKHLPQTVRSIGADSLWTTILFTDHVISHLHHLVCCLDVMQSLFCSQLATVLFPISKWTLNENAAPPNSQYISHQRAHWSGADPVQCIQVFYLLSKSPFSLISVSLATLSQICVSFYFKRHFFQQWLNYRYKRFAEEHLYHFICLWWCVCVCILPWNRCSAPACQQPPPADLHMVSLRFAAIRCSHLITSERSNTLRTFPVNHLTSDPTWQNLSGSAAPCPGSQTTGRACLRACVCGYALWSCLIRPINVGAYVWMSTCTRVTGPYSVVDWQPGCELCMILLSLWRLTRPRHCW